jgi:Domain of unknown function (DUF1707)
VVYGPDPAYRPPPGAPGGFVAGVNPNWLAASADRERAVGVLRAAFTEGRLSHDELNDRVAQAYTARTYGQLWALTADLPAGPLPYPQYLPALAHPAGAGAVIPPSAARTSKWGPTARLIIIALVIFTLAALVTAVITAHGQAVVVHTTPFQQTKVVPYVNPLAPPGASRVGSAAKGG